jgi:tetratricopeptide (TPR) repeat protein
MSLAALGNLANFYRTNGRLEESAQTMRTVLAGFQKLQDSRSIGTALNNIGRTSYMLNRLDDAELAYQQALAIVEPIGERFSSAFALGNLADIWIARGKLQQALGALERAISLTEETANWMHAAAFLAKLADLRLLTGERELAREIAEESRTAFIHSGASQYIPAYCDIVRLRLAADAATDPEELMVRKTARVQALSPRASWLPVMKQILAGMKKAGSGALSTNLELRLDIAAGDALVSEIAAAVKENRAALVYHGYRPAELSAELREALLQQLSQTKRLDLLSRMQPELLAALKNPAV